MTRRRSQRAEKAEMETEESVVVDTPEEQEPVVATEEVTQPEQETDEVEEPVEVETEEEPVEESVVVTEEPVVVTEESNVVTEESNVVADEEPAKMDTEDVPPPGTEQVVVTPPPVVENPVGEQPAVEKPAVDPATASAIDELDIDLPDEIDTPKLLVQELDIKTTEDNLKEYFSAYGEVRLVKLKKDDEGNSKGFCFIVFSDPANISKALEKEEHTISEKVVKLTKAMPSSEKMKTNKLFIGGLPAALSEEHLRSYFEKYGKIYHFQFVINKMTNIRKAFCFVTFENPDAVEKITEGKVPPNSVVHTIEGHTVDCKKKFDEDHPVQKKIKAKSSQYNYSNRTTQHQGYNSGYTQGQYDAAAAAYNTAYGAYGSYGAGYDPYYAQYGYPGYAYPGYAYPGYAYPGYTYPPTAYGTAYGPVKQSRSNTSYKPY